MSEERDDRVAAAQADDEGMTDETQDSMLSMDELMASYEGPEPLSELREGDLITGTVVQINDNGVMVDVGTKSEGLIPRQELEAIRNEIAVGEPIKVVVTRREGEDGHVMLSKRQADVEAAWESIFDKQGSNEILEAKVIEAVKGGLLVDLGVYGQGFVPASHVSVRRPRNLNKYLGQTLKLVVIEVERKRKRVVLSHRKVVEDERAAERDVTLGNLREGQVRRGIVRRITDFGAFVDIGGVDGLLHVSELSWKRVDSPQEQMRVGDPLEVMVLKLNLEEGRISLGRRQLLQDPWREIPKLYREGSTVRATVVKQVREGVIARLPIGWDLFVPIPEELRATPAVDEAAEAPTEAPEPVAAEAAVEAEADAAAESVVTEPVAAEPVAAAEGAEAPAAAEAPTDPFGVGATLELHVERIIMAERDLICSLARSRPAESRSASRGDSDRDRSARAPLARGRYSDRRDQDESGEGAGERGAAPAPRRDRRRDRDDRDQRDAMPLEHATTPPVRRTLGDLMGDKLRALLEGGNDEGSTEES